MWSLDSDYDGCGLFAQQVFFPMAGRDQCWRKLKAAVRAELDESRLAQFHGTVLLPFEAGGHGKTAVKIVDDRGIESLKIVPLRWHYTVAVKRREIEAWSRTSSPTLY
jgi:adenine-specific DNA-methyltransferase